MSEVQAEHEAAEMASVEARVGMPSRVLARGRLRLVIAPLAFALVVLAIWQTVVSIADVQEYVLPAPLDILRSFAGNWHQLFSNAWVTLQEAVAGFFIGNVIALVLAAFMAEFRLFESAVYPTLVAWRTVPTVAFAPLLLIWFGFNLWPVIVVCAVICFFPTLVNAVEGFRSVDTSTMELMRGLNASRWEIFIKLRVFVALPYIFAALKIAVASALIGAVVGEWVVAQHGLGYLTILANNYLDTLLLFRAVIALAVIGVTWFAAVVWLESVVLSWRKLGQERQ